MTTGLENKWRKLKMQPLEGTSLPWQAIYPKAVP